MTALVVVGNGASACYQRLNSNAVLETAGGSLWMIDCGWTAREGLRRLGLRLADVVGVVVTHTHADHIGNLEPLAFEHRFGEGRTTRKDEGARQGRNGAARPAIVVAGKIGNALWEHSLRGGLEQTAEEPMERDDWFDWRELEKDQEHDLDGTTVRLVQVSHMAGMQCFAVMVNGRHLWTGDTRPIPQVVEREAPETIWHDARTAGASHPAHATARELVEAYGKEVCRRTWLIGVEDAIAPDDRRYVEDHFAGIASEGQRFEIASSGASGKQEAKRESIPGRMRIVQGRRKWLVRAAWEPFEGIRGFLKREDAETYCRNNGYQVVE